MSWEQDQERLREERDRRQREQQEREYEEEHRWQRQLEEARQEAEYVRQMCEADGHRIHHRLGRNGPPIVECYCGQEEIQVLFG